MKEKNEKSKCKICAEYSIVVFNDSYKCESCNFEIKMQNIDVKTNYLAWWFIKYNRDLTKEILNNNKICELIVANILTKFYKSNVLWNNTNEIGKDISLLDSKLHYEIARSINNNQKIVDYIGYLEKAIELKDAKKYNPKINLIILELNQDDNPEQINNIRDLVHQMDPLNWSIDKYLAKIKESMQATKYINYESSLIITNRWSNDIKSYWNFNVFYWDKNSQQYTLNKNLNLNLDIEILKIINQYFEEELWKQQFYYYEYCLWDELKKEHFMTKIFDDKKFMKSLDQLIKNICNKISKFNINNGKFIVNGNFSLGTLKWINDDLEIDVSLGLEKMF